MENAERIVRCIKELQAIHLSGSLEEGDSPEDIIGTWESLDRRKVMKEELSAKHGLPLHQVESLMEIVFKYDD